LSPLIRFTPPRCSYYIQDYRNIYVGTGRAPQGGNINTGATTTHAVCRPEDLNHFKNPDEPDAEATSDATVMKEDRTAEPITEDKMLCGLGELL